MQLGYSSQAQTKLLLIDSISKLPVPYASVWVIDKEIGTTSNDIGEIEISGFVNIDQFLVYAVGYKVKKISASIKDSVVLLEPIDLLLNEVQIVGSISDEPVVLGGFKKSKVNRMGYGCSKVPWILARYFDGTCYANQSVYLHELKFYTFSEINNATMGLRIYQKDTAGLPGKLLHNQPIKFTVQKGFKKTKIDLSEYNIQVSKGGFFVAFEWLIIEPNIFYQNFIERDTVTDKIIRKYQKIEYQPSVCTQVANDSVSMYGFIRGKWDSYPKNVHREAGMIFGTPAIEISIKK